MNPLKPIKQLPKLENYQEWACKQGCDKVSPKLHRNIYAESWDIEGNKAREEAEHYYTCQKGHLLAVWDTALNEYEDLPSFIFSERKNIFNFEKSTSSLLDTSII